MQGRYPAIITSYDQNTRLCKVKLPFITDGSSEDLTAEIEYSIGDNSLITEINIKPNDAVWVSFIGGDANYPIITGYRNPHTNNSINWRKWYHENIEIKANKTLIIDAGEAITETTKTSHLTANKRIIDADVEINGNVIIKGNIETTGSFTNNGVNVGSTHKHPQGVDSKGGSQQDTGTPK